MNKLAEDNDNLKPCFIYRKPLANCKPHATGHISRDLIARQLGKERKVKFYFLGPKPFMRQVPHIASELGIPADQIHYGFFGPAEALTDPTR